jgi:membrane protease YdiL (CAAX protease family)
MFATPVNPPMKVSHGMTGLAVAQILSAADAAGASGASAVGPATDAIRHETAAVIGAFIVVLAITLVYAGPLSPRAFRRAPRRQGELGLVDVAGAILIVVIGTLASGQLIRLARDLGWGPATEEGEQLIGMLGFEAAMAAAVVYVLVRAREAIRGGCAVFGCRCDRPLHLLRLGTLTALAAIPATMGMLALGAWFAVRILDVPTPAAGHSLLEIFSQSDSPGIRVGIALSAVLIAPIVEEFLFRGLLQTALQQSGFIQSRWRVILLTAALFSVVHAGGVIWQAMPGLFVLAIALGWLYERTGSLWPGIALHMTFNALNLLLSDLYHTQQKSAETVALLAAHLGG